MCNLFLKLLPTANKGQYKLILASNRDESIQRPATTAHFWKENLLVLGGRDMQDGCEGGTWLAMSKTGIIGVLLNVKGEDHDLKKLGRGFIVADLAKNKNSVDDYFKNLAKEGNKYNKFQLVAVTIRPEDSKTIYFTNSPNCSESNIKTIEGVVGVGNGTLATPFKKTYYGQKNFEQIVDKFGNIDDKEKLIDALLAMLKCNEPHYPDANLDVRSPELTEEHKKQYSSMFIDMPKLGYGTRTHTIILVEEDGTTEFLEWSLLPDDDSKELKWVFTKEQFKIQ